MKSHKIAKATFADFVNFSDVSSFIFKENYISIEHEDNPSKKVCLVEEELDGIDIYDIGNLEDLLRLVVFIDKEQVRCCASLYMSTLTNIRGEGISSTSKWNTVNQISMIFLAVKFCCGYSISLER